MSEYLKKIRRAAARLEQDAVLHTFGVPRYYDLMEKMADIFSSGKTPTKIIAGLSTALVKLDAADPDHVSHAYIYGVVAKRTMRIDMMYAEWSKHPFTVVDQPALNINRLVINISRSSRDDIFTPLPSLSLSEHAIIRLGERCGRYPTAESIIEMCMRMALGSQWLMFTEGKHEERELMYPLDGCVAACVPRLIGKKSPVIWLDVRTVLSPEMLNFAQQKQELAMRRMLDAEKNSTMEELKLMTNRVPVLGMAPVSYVSRALENWRLNMRDTKNVANRA